MVTCDPKSFLRMRVRFPSVSSVSFYTCGWELLDEDFHQCLWMRDDRQSTMMSLFSDHPCDPRLLSERRLRELARLEAMVDGGALISADLIKMGGITAARCITKAPQNPRGTTYYGTIIVPFKSCHITISLRCRESGTIGMRQTLIFAERTAHGRPTTAWQRDPYDASLKASSMRDLSEDERYDEQFPDHPLSRVRKYLYFIQRSFSYDQSMEPARVCPLWRAKLLAG